MDSDEGKKNPEDTQVIDLDDIRAKVEQHAQHVAAVCLQEVNEVLRKHKCAIQPSLRISGTGIQFETPVVFVGDNSNG